MFFLKKEVIAGLALMGLTIAPSELMAAGVYDTSKYIDLEINSGNPAFPFPQFLEYKVGKTLAKYNAEGVTHADMEKTMREAYQIMSHRARYTGEEVGGVKYISFNPSDVQNEDKWSYSPSSSEGDGCMLLAAAIFADQPTFNGLWMWIHDYKIPHAVKYSDGKILFQDYPYSPGLPCLFTTDEKLEGEKTGPNGVYPDEASATDGDEDIALALVIANKQWGDTMRHNGKIVKDANGEPILYRQMTKDILSAFVDTFMYTVDNGFGTVYNAGHTSGDIGIDGYIHGSNKSCDMTNWRETQTDYPDVFTLLNSGAPDAFFDYAAPAYYNEFAKWLEADNKDNPDPSNVWRIQQYKRGEASSDWLMGQAYDQGYIPSIGKFSFEKDETKPEFSSAFSGEDCRLGWRTVLNYLWHGNPTTTWDPLAHQVKEGENSYEYDMGVRFAEFLKKAPTQGLYKGEYLEKTTCAVLGASPEIIFNWSGVCNIVQQYGKDGSVDDYFLTNFTVGCSAPSVVASGDLELLGDIYRECELRWDGVSYDAESDDDRYINNMARYFHGWFRTLGMLVTSGNLAAPADMKSSANVKVYMSVDKTVAYKGDNVTYEVQCRNYGSMDAKDAVITTKLDDDYEFVRATKGGTYNAANNTITWKLGDIPGFKTGALASTMDTVEFMVRVKNTENKLVGLTSTISGSNFEEWESNAYPNNATYTMERNLVDILDVPMTLEKSFDVAEASVNDTVEYTLKLVSRSRTALNGGRENVRLSYANYTDDVDFYQYYRIWHDAPEAYINMGDFRVSYFMYDTCGVYSETNKTGYDIQSETLTRRSENYGYNDEDPTIIVEDITSGEDENGKWNKRVIVRFPNLLSAATSHLLTNDGVNRCIHKGVIGTGIYRTKTKQEDLMNSYINDDWSYSDNVKTGKDYEKYNYFPVTPGFYNEETLGNEIANYARNVCDDDVDNFDRVLVEQWDGYTWRRIQGTAPTYSRITKNAFLVDTLPTELEIIAQPNALGVNVEDGKINIEMPDFNSGDSLVYRFLCKVVKKNNAGEIKTRFASVRTATDIVVSNSTALKIKEPTSVKNVAIGQDELVDVYSTSGALLKRQVEYKNALVGLQPGVYLVNGVKTIVK